MRGFAPTCFGQLQRAVEEGERLLGVLLDAQLPERDEARALGLPLVDLLAQPQALRIELDRLLPVAEALVRMAELVKRPRLSRCGSRRSRRS